MYWIIRKLHGIALELSRRFCRWYYPRRVRGIVAECGPELAVSRPCTILDGDCVRLGNNVNFNGAFIAGHGGLSIGDNFHSGRNLRILTVNHDFDGGSHIPYGTEIIKRPVVIGDNVWIADSVIVTPGSRIGDGAVIGAGSVVVGEVPALAVAAGNPARVVRERDRAHYDALKDAGRFM